MRPLKTRELLLLAGVLYRGKGLENVKAACGVALTYPTLTTGSSS